MATPPTFVASYGNVAYSTATKTASVTVQAGDLIVVGASSGDEAHTVSTPSGGGLTFTLQQQIQSVTQQINTYVWTATSASAQTFTLTVTGGASAVFTFFAEVWRNHNGVGSSAKKTATSTTSLSLSTQGANSAIVMVDADWNGVSGSTRTYVTSVGAFSERAYQFGGAGTETLYGGHYADSGAVGSKTVGMSAPTGQRPSLIALEVLAAPPVATGSLTVTATALPANVPPAVRIDVNDTRSPGQAAQLTIVRNNPDGTQSPVRTFDGNPLQLSGGIGLLYDYEAPLGVPVSYMAMEAPTIVTPQVTMASSQVWLVHPGIPTLSIPVGNFLPGSFTQRTAPVMRGVFRPMGRANAVVVTDGARHGVESSFSILVRTQADLDAVRALLDDTSPVLLNVPQSLGYNIDSRYIAVGDVSYEVVTDKVFEPWMKVTLPFITVDRPAGGSQSARTWADVLANFGSWSAVLAHYRSWADVLAGP